MKKGDVHSSMGCVIEWRGFRCGTTRWFVSFPSLSLPSSYTDITHPLPKHAVIQMYEMNKKNTKNTMDCS